VQCANSAALKMFNLCTFQEPVLIFWFSASNDDFQKYLYSNFDGKNIIIFWKNTKPLAITFTELWSCCALLAEDSVKVEVNSQPGDTTGWKIQFSFTRVFIDMLFITLRVIFCLFCLLVSLAARYVAFSSIGRYNQQKKIFLQVLPKQIT